MNSSNPLLSICIPTYNRAHLLESALRALLPQAKAAGNDVEVIVSDNCSTDNTREILKRAQTWGPLEYHSNGQNEGAARNILYVTSELAHGEFVWVIGDDDLVLPGTVARVLTVLKTNPEVDYIFLNTCAGEIADRSATEQQVFAEQIDASKFRPHSQDPTEHIVDSWEELIDPNVDGVFLGALMCSVVRLSVWKKYPLQLEIRNDIFDSLEQAYPHAVILANTMKGRRAYYCGQPGTINFFGKQEWMDYLPILVLVRLQELLNLYSRVGIDKARIWNCRSSLLRISEEHLRVILVNPGVPARKYFSFHKFIWNNRGNSAQLSRLIIPVLQKMVIVRIVEPLERWAVQILPGPIYLALRNLKRAAFHTTNNG